MNAPRGVAHIARLVWLGLFLTASRCGAEGFAIATTGVDWQQVGPTSFTVCVERERFSTLDRVGRMVFAVQVGQGPSRPALETLTLRWTVTRRDTRIAGATAPIDRGAVAVGFDLRGLAEGRYEVAGELLQDGKPIARTGGFFRLETEAEPALSGRVALHLPRGVPLKAGTYPIVCGVPFPKGVLWDPRQARVVTAEGKPVPSQTHVRSRWGHTPETSIRWLGVEFQAGPAASWWPARQGTAYFLEYGPAVRAAEPPARVRVTETEAGIAVDTGPLQFLVRRDRFNLLDKVRLDGREVLGAGDRDGLYLVDHEGSVYRAANDAGPRVTVEEQGPLRVALRAEGWYVRDGTPGTNLHWTLPTDRLCKFITRIEAYADKPYVRVVNTWVITYDTFSVRLKDLGLALSLNGATRAVFGVEDADPLFQAIPATGVRLVQHLPHAFALEDGTGKTLAEGRHSAGWVAAATRGGTVSVGHRDTWQRFPKELEALPDGLRLHLWPAHNRVHPELKPNAPDEIHKLWFAHSGREMDLRQPWSTYFAVAKAAGDPSDNIYRPGGTALGGVFSSALGASLTSDILIHFADSEAETRDVAGVFQAAPHALADPAWTCASLAMGWLQAYAPERFPVFEQTIEDLQKGYWETQDTAEEYGLWLYRAWHHNTYLGGGRWEPYRLYNATHHYEAWVPWMLYARSGDPFYMTQGWANMRMLPEAQIIHYDDPSYPHREFYGGQKRLVGSTKHTNGLNLWGGDHAVLGHLTCYNGLILAHYLTGDLRLREIVVDEWQKTLLSERANPAFAPADRSGSPGRDNNNALGELIDLYQLTYEPALLTYLPPLLGRFHGDMYHWGQALHNVLLFHGSRQARDNLLAGIDEYRRSGGVLGISSPQGSGSNNLWYTASPHENFALAWLLDPGLNTHMEAQCALMSRDGKAVREQKPRAVAFCQVPDYVAYAPRALLPLAGGADQAVFERVDAMSRLLPANMRETPFYNLKALTSRQMPYVIGPPTLEKLLELSPMPMPMGGPGTNDGLRCVVREDIDGAFPVYFRGQVAREAASVRIYAPDGARVLAADIPVGTHAPFTVTVPKDGQTGEYTLFIRYAETSRSSLFVPLTDLPGEVYHIRGGWWFEGHNAGGYSRRYTRSPGERPVAVNARILGKAALLDMTTGRALAVVDGTTPRDAHMGRLEAEVGPGGAWLVSATSYGVADAPLILSVTPGRWFAPSLERLELTP